ncbi:MAG: hypothetical protein K5839_02665, partial [Treponemataceae bacterium]|nr:hypothetical protein [Treponemataceae bacterium]
ITLPMSNFCGIFSERITHGQSNQEVYLEYVNEVPIYFAGTKSLEKENMIAFIDVIPCQTEFVVYIFLVGEFKVPALFKDIMSNSLIARSDALYTWLEKAYTEEKK